MGQEEFLTTFLVDRTDAGKVSIFGIYSKGSKVLFAEGHEEDIPQSLWRDVRRAKKGLSKFKVEEIP